MYAMPDLSLPKLPKRAIVPSQLLESGERRFEGYAGKFDNGRNAMTYTKLLLLATFRRKKQVFEKRAPESGGAPSSDNGCRFASQYKAGPTDLAGRPWRG